MPCRLTPEGRSRPAPRVPVHVACGRSCLAARERYAACIDAARLSANTRPSHAAEIRLARRAACRIDRGETGFGTNVSPVSVHAHARRIESWSAGFSARGYLLSLPWSTRHTAALWWKRHGKRPGGSLFPLSPAFKRRLTRAAWRVSRLGKTGVTVTRACTYVSKPRPSPRIVGRRFVPPAISTQDRRQDVRTPGLERKPVPGSVPGVAHVLAGGVAATYAALWRGARGADRGVPPHPRVTRRATRSARETAEHRRDLCLDSRVPLRTK